MTGRLDDSSSIDLVDSSSKTLGQTRVRPLYPTVRTEPGKLVPPPPFLYIVQV
jgi:hypothetical protein